MADRLRQPLYSWYPPLWRGMRALTQGRFDEVERGLAEAAAIGAAAQSENSVMLTSTLDMWRALFAGERVPDFPRWIMDRYSDLIPTVASLSVGLAFVALHQATSTRPRASTNSSPTTTSFASAVMPKNCST